MKRAAGAGRPAGIYGSGAARAHRDRVLAEDGVSVPERRPRGSSALARVNHDRADRSPPCSGCFARDVLLLSADSFASSLVAAVNASKAVVDGQEDVILDQAFDGGHALAVPASCRAQAVGVAQGVYARKLVQLAAGLHRCSLSLAGAILGRFLLAHQRKSGRCLSVLVVDTYDETPLKMRAASTDVSPCTVSTVATPLRSSGRAVKAASKAGLQKILQMEMLVCVLWEDVDHPGEVVDV